MLRVFSVFLFLFCQVLCIAQSDTLQVTDTTVNEPQIPLFNLGADEAEGGAEQQDVSSLLQSSRDVFAQFAGFQFGAAHYRMRGLNARNVQVSINGLCVNNPETGAASWTNWGGLNDITRYSETRIGTCASRYTFSGAGGYTNMDVKASSFKKGLRVSYSSANRFFRHRAMLSYNSGMNSRGWAFSLSASYRGGENLLSPGTYFRAASVYAGLDKKFNDKHLVSLVMFAAPLEQGRSSAATAEAYELTGNNYYNSNWGLQAGKVRNAAVSRNNKPTSILSHVFTPNENTRINSSIYFSKGKSSMSGLTWNNAPNPDPDYYRYLPSYYYLNGDSALGNSLKDSWLSTPESHQIKWDQLIAMNQANLYTDPHLLGQGINTTETRARYIVEHRVENITHLVLNTVYNKRKGQNFISAGLQAGLYKNRKYKEVEDLLGASFWLDVDQFAAGLGTEEYLVQNDLDNPNKKVKQNGRFGYDYNICINKAESWIQLEHNGKRLEYYWAANLSASSIYREGFYANGKFPNDSKGKSEVLNFLNGMLKAGLTAKLSGRHFITFNTVGGTRTPEFTALFISPRVRNDHVSNPTNEKIFSADLSYHNKYPALKTRATVFFSAINDQTWVRTFWHDTYNTNVNLIMQNLNQQNFGFELGFEKTIKVSHVIQSAFSMAQFVYSNRPTLQAWQDNNNTPLFTGRISYLKNYRIGGGPQSVIGLGYRYNGRKHWFAGLTGNYLAEIYIDPNPDRRTEEALGKFTAEEKDLALQIAAQEKLPDFFVLNGSAGKSYRIRRKYNLNLSLSVNNILNNTKTRVSGFESLRWDQNNIQKFPNKYTYMGGISYMLIINLII